MPTSQNVVLLLQFKWDTIVHTAHPYSVDRESKNCHLFLMLKERLTPERTPATMNRRKIRFNIFLTRTGNSSYDIQQRPNYNIICHTSWFYNQ